MVNLSSSCEENLVFAEDDSCGSQIHDIPLENIEFEIKDDDGVVFTINQSYSTSDVECSDEEELPNRKISIQSPTSLKSDEDIDVENLRRQGRLLLVSLLENFCSLYDKNPGKNHKLFLILCRKLSSMGILESADFVDEAANVRTVYKRAFRDLVFEAIKGLEGTEAHRMLLKDAESLTNEDDLDNSDDAESDVESDDDFQDMSAFDDLLFHERSRYLEDFVELGCLGKGGFGTVFQAQNKLDGRQYAIKKIRFSSVYSSRYQRIVREVKSLACMDHQNIVRYNAAWVEECKDPARITTKDNFTDESDVSTPPAIETSSDVEDSGMPTKPSSSSQLLMYIQMELCQYTLCDWISRRNALMFSGIKWELEDFPVDYYRMINTNLAGNIDINVHENKRIFKCIVKGLQYIHSHGLIHRDLKPQNIFFHGNDHIPKIGDFGLVSTGLAFSDSDPSSPTASLENSFTGDLTTGVGTSVYGSPEQLNGSLYDEKSDIYSLGIILFELFFPVKTQMERSRVLMDLKQNKQFPTDFLKRWPKEAALIWCCLSDDPTTRPSADEILESELLDQDLEEHFLRISEDNEDLRELLRMQFDDNSRLKIENELQALEIEALKAKLKFLMSEEAC